MSLPKHPPIRRGPTLTQQQVVGVIRRLKKGTPQTPALYPWIDIRQNADGTWQITIRKPEE